MENSPSFTSPTSTTSAANNSSNTTGTSAVTAGTNSSIGPNTTVLARALFDNSAEVAQELTFSRGDVLIVLKRDPPGFEGWWICSLAGRVGIAPGNRLEILGSVKPKIRTVGGRTTTSPHTSITTTVTAQVNPPEVDPYDVLPAVIEVAPPIPPHSSRMDQSIYANFYENYPPGGALDSRNGSPSFRNPTALSRYMSSKPEEGPIKSVSFAAPKSTAITNTVNSATEATNSHLTAECNSKDHQDTHSSESIPKRSVKRSGLSSVAQASKHSVRFVDPAPPEADASNRCRDSTCMNIVAEDKLPSDPPQRLTVCSGHHEEVRLSPDPTDPPSSTVNMENGPLSNLLTVPPTFRLTRSTSAPLSARFSRPATSFSSWQQTHSRIELLINEALASMERFEKGGSTQTLIQKMCNFEQGLSAELLHLEQLCDTFNSDDLVLNDFLQQERQKIARLRDGRLLQDFQRLKEPNPEKGFNALAFSLEQISLSTQAIIDTVQLNRFDCADIEHSRRGQHMEDNFGSLSVSDREDSATTSLDSNDPTDLSGLLHVYAAQFHSHTLLVRGTAEEFLGCLRCKVNEPRTVRGYRLPTAGVLIANAKFLLRCSSQLVSLAANLSAALQSLPPSEVSNSAPDIEKLRSGLEASGNAVCEALKGLIAQTKDVAGCLTSPSLDLPTTATTLASKPVVVLGPEMERLVGAVQDVVATTEGLRQTVANSSALRNSVSSVER